MSYVNYEDRCDISVLVGKIITEITKDRESHPEELVLTLDDGTKYMMYHSQSCCETVYLEDINGDLEDLIGSPILEASCRTLDNENPPGVKPEYQDDYLWTFYHLVTAKGTVVLRWYGDSNGYYSVEVTFGKVTE